jgi:hypothetical protein
MRSLLPIAPLATVSLPTLAAETQKQVPRRLRAKVELSAHQVARLPAFMGEGASLRSEPFLL